MTSMNWALITSLFVLSYSLPGDAQAKPKASTSKIQEAQGMQSGGGKQGMRGMGKHHMRGMKGMHGMMSYGSFILSKADELKLTDEQIGKIYRIVSTQTKAHMGAMQGMKSGMLTLHGLLMDPAASEADIRAAAKKQSAVWDALIEDAIVERNQVNALLTPDQLALVKTMKPEMPNPQGMEMDEDD